MRRLISVLAVAALLAAMMVGAPAALAQEEEPPEPKFCVLHSPSGDPDKANVIEVDFEGAQEHFAEHSDPFIPEPPTGCLSPEEFPTL